MSLINKHENCIGLTLFKWNQRRIEIWFCPSGYQIEEHSHPSEDVELVYIFGNTIFFRRNLLNGKYEEGKPKFLQKFTVMHFHSHGFTVGRLPLIFINFQKFLNGYKPMSAAKDFLIT